MPMIPTTPRAGAGVVATRRNSLILPMTSRGDAPTADLTLAPREMNSHPVIVKVLDRCNPIRGVRGVKEAGVHRAVVVVLVHEVLEALLIVEAEAEAVVVALTAVRIPLNQSKMVVLRAYRRVKQTILVHLMPIHRLLFGRLVLNVLLVEGSAR